ncbi:ABC transporter permease [Mesorhizobium sp. M0088]|uniref:ABC transporter permease n=1 Tax=Mesorhizobium sp. M0088 TaxID=2956873 RepID=UPI00333A0508
MLLLSGWQFTSTQQFIDPVLLPSPSEVAEVLYRLSSSGEMFRHLAISFQRVSLGFAFGSAAAIVFASITGYSTVWRSIIDPTVHALRTVPGLAWIPMFILWFGIDEFSKVSLIALAAFFPTYLNLMSGIARVDRRLIEVGLINRLTGFRLIKTILFPSSLPFLFIGLRQSMGVCWLVVVGAELMGASSGVGYLLMDGEMTGRPEIIVACMIVFALSGKTTDWILACLAAKALHWQEVREHMS